MFNDALDLVLRELDRRRQGGYDDWRANAAAVDRLLTAQPGVNAPAMVEGTPSTIQPATEAALPEPMPKPDDSAGLSLFGEELPAPKPTRVAKASVLVGEPGAYEPVTDSSLPKPERLAQLRACSDRLPCPQCPYGRGPDNNHVVFGVGNVDTEVVFIGEAPGADEDAKGEPFVGRAGQLLNKIIATMGFKREQIYLANVLKCRPPTPGQAFGNRKPTTREMHSCRPCLFEQLDIIRPKAIVALGATAIEGLLDLDAPMRDLRGRWHDFKGIPVMVTYHPSYLLRNQAPSEKRKVWEDLLLVKEHLGHTITDKDRGYFLVKD